MSIPKQPGDIVLDFFKQLGREDGRGPVGSGNSAASPDKNRIPIKTPGVQGIFDSSQMTQQAPPPSGPPPITDLQWVFHKDHLQMEWTNPAFHTKNACLYPERNATWDLTPERYEIRFAPGTQNPTEQDLMSGISLDFTWEWHKQSSLTVPARLLSEPQERMCRFLIHFSDHYGYSQFRERQFGSYGVRYFVSGLGWSRFSNHISDTGKREIHDFEIRPVFQAGVSELFGGGYALFEIRDTFSNNIRSYKAIVAGLSVGLPVGGSGPIDQSWHRFKPTRHMHLEDFDQKGIRIVSQGVAIVIGYGRSSVSIHDSQRAAEADIGQIALIDFGWDWTKGAEATGIQVVVGRLEPE